MSAVGLAGFVKGNDVFMPEFSGVLCLPEKTFQHFRAGSQVRGQHLERHFPAQIEVYGTVNRSHSTSADTFDHLVSADERLAVAPGQRFR